MNSSEDNILGYTNQSVELSKAGKSTTKLEESEKQKVNPKGGPPMTNSKP
jgi:hypothetical protein